MGKIPKRITLDDLAAMMKGEFDNIGQKINGVDGRLDEMNGRLDRLGSEIKKRPTLAQIDLKFQNIEERLKKDLGDQPLERDRTLNRKTDTVAEKLGAKSVFTTRDVREVARIAPVAVAHAAE